MTNLERINAHNQRLASLKETISELPDNGSAGGYETCTVTIASLPAYSNIVFNYVKDGEIMIKTFGGVPYDVPESTLSQMSELQSVLKGSDFYCGKIATSPSQVTVSTTGDIEVLDNAIVPANQLGAHFRISGDGSITIS